MRLPFRQLKIAGQTIKVRIEKDLDLYGCWYRDEKVIAIGKYVLMDPSQLHSTLRHEMRHAALSLSGVAHALTDIVEEQVVRCMEEIADPAIEEMEKKLYQYGQ